MLRALADLSVKHHISNRCHSVDATAVDIYAVAAS
jgi:hypothetical protein